MSRGAPAWLTRVVACPGCGGSLSARPGGQRRAGKLAVGLLGCRQCGAFYPVLGGVAILAADPAHYLASYRDAVLAALAEHRLASRAAVELVAAFAEAGRGAEPLGFSDDSVAADLGPAPAPLGGPGAAERFRDFLAAVDAAPAPDDVALELAPARMRVAVEIGCGAGALTARLRARADRVLVCDLSLRALLGARAAASRRRGGGELGCAVADAQSLPLRAATAAGLFAVNLIDLLDDPGAFLAAAAAALAPRGRLLLTTPDPSLGGGSDERLAVELARAGLRVESERDAVAWLRRHSARHVEVYFVRALAAARS